MEEQSVQLRRQMDVQLQALREEVEKKDAIIHELSCSLASLQDRIVDMEDNEQAAARRIGKRWMLCV